MQAQQDPKKLRRGIYLLPNLFTTAALFAGFYAIVAAMADRFEAAAVAISDMVSFGIGPALVVYQWALVDTGKLGWLAAFFYAAATALRLARFNTQVETADKSYFQGLPCPLAAAVVAGLVWFSTDYGISGASMMPAAFAVTIITGALMVSNIRYHSFKRLDLKGRVPFISILVVVLIFVLVSSDPALVLFALSVLYALSGPVLTLVSIRRRRAARRAGAADESVHSK
jgi:CDP-diacylglycerol--serine O-phosphatidyltransferase